MSLGLRLKNEMEWTRLQTLNLECLLEISKSFWNCFLLLFGDKKEGNRVVVQLYTLYPRKKLDSFYFLSKLQSKFHLIKEWFESLLILSKTKLSFKRTVWGLRTCSFSAIQNCPYFWFLSCTVRCLYFATAVFLLIFLVKSFSNLKPNYSFGICSSWGFRNKVCL